VAVPDATEQEIENALGPSSTFDEIAVYDVGQGSANGLISNQEVVCYFDFGGGAAPNTFTFPPALASFCQCNRPPIILSHWDHDHWSSEGRDTRVHTQTWIVPRQASNSTKRAPHHSSLIKAIQAAGGSILVWPSGLSTKRIGQLEISLCTGSSKNTSGLSLEVHPPSGVSARPVLMPADAGYDDLRVVPASGQHDAILCPHHGGLSNSPNIPKPPSGPYQRLIYSYGPKNTYKHPLFKTYDPHHLADWFDRGHETDSPATHRAKHRRQNIQRARPRGVRLDDKCIDPGTRLRRRPGHPAEVSGLRRVLRDNCRIISRQLGYTSAQSILAMMRGSSYRIKSGRLSLRVAKRARLVRNS
jgi:hypothetical protein